MRAPHARSTLPLLDTRPPRAPPPPPPPGPPPPPRPGAATKLESQFRLTYSMILNLLRVEDLKASGAAGVCVWGEECVWGGGC